jgi:hypothetical protein
MVLSNIDTQHPTGGLQSVNFAMSRPPTIGHDLLSKRQNAGFIREAYSSIINDHALLTRDGPIELTAQ